jgi:hypothetical protein
MCKADYIHCVREILSLRVRGGVGYHQPGRWTFGLEVGQISSQYRVTASPRCIPNNLTGYCL